ncbi:MAG: hypothetical protein FJX35_02805 [Alphaproteobacteria bacterium]|nr:hypothetical protein [Alphaproteobacteria bacterium]
MSQPPTKVEIIMPPNLIKAKASMPGGLSEKEAIKRGDAKVQELAANYVDWAKADVDELQVLMRALLQEKDEEGRRVAVRKLYKKAHDIKGQGGTFDFPLVTMIGDSLCNYIESLGEDTNVSTEVVVMHVEAARLILMREVKGMGGQTEQQLLDGLRKVVKKTTKAQPTG